MARLIQIESTFRHLFVGPVRRYRTFAPAHGVTLWGGVFHPRARC